MDARGAPPRSQRRRRRRPRGGRSAVAAAARRRPWDDCPISAALSTRIVALGDLLLDIVVRLDAPLNLGDDAVAQTRTGAGGQAANVAAWAVALGAEGRLVAKRGDDAAAELVAGELTERGVEVVGPVERGRNGVVVSIVAPDGQRTMASDRGVAPFLRSDELEMRWFGNCSWLHVTGYALFRSPIDEAAAKAAGAVRGQGGRISVDLSSASLIRDFGADRLRRRLELLAPDVVFGNADELDAIGGTFPAETWVLKLGAEGVELSDGRRLPARDAEVVDTTGAGDALAAGYLVGGADLGLDAAARCVATLGTMPT